MQPEKVMGPVMLISVCLSFVMVLVGGFWYLYQQGLHSITYQHFTPDFQISAFGKQFLVESFSTPQGFIQLGLFLLVLIQLLRVLLTAYYFVKMRDVFFTVLAVFISGVLAYTLFGK